VSITSDDAVVDLRLRITQRFGVDATTMRKVSSKSSLTVPIAASQNGMPAAKFFRTPHDVVVLVADR
jgi:hypothetical protein